MKEQTTERPVKFRAFVTFSVHALHMEGLGLCYFPLFEYSIDYFYINIWCVYKFMAFLQYIFLKALRSLDRDYIFLISLP